MQADQRRAERRRNLLTIGTAVALAVTLVGAAVFFTYREQQKRADVEAATKAAAEAPIEGVQDFPDLSRNHVTTAVDYPQDPPVGGDHAGVWTNCGTYADPVEPTQGVHSLEHGAVWITYRPDLSPEQVEILTQLAQTNSYALLSPFEGLPSPVTASAWGMQLAVDGATDPRLAAFLQKYAQGPQTPEPGAACTGGAGVTG
jgi:hypothetical protein